VLDQSYHNVINNELTTTATVRQAICPSTEEPLWDVPVSTQEDVDRAVAAGKAAFPGWRAKSIDERAEYLVKLGKAITANQQEFITLLGKEVGKPPQAGGFEMFLVSQHLETVPTLRLPEEKPEDNEDVRTEILAGITISG
jgi:acyl-CoA reductase-like NAD-dependent aldehyde dehydrogenase